MVKLLINMFAQWHYTFEGDISLFRLEIKSQIDAKVIFANEYPLFLLRNYHNSRFPTSEGWGLFLLSPNALPGRIAPAFLTFLSLKSV